MQSLKIENVGMLAAGNAVIGGTVSVIGGGKFANGAVTGAFTMLFNELVHEGTVKKNRTLENFIGPSPDCDPNDIIDEKGKKILPNNEADGNAFVHDGDYFQVGASGVTGALFNAKTANADLKLAVNSAKTMVKFWLGRNDNVTLSPVTYRTAVEATAITVIFTPIATYKLLYNTINDRPFPY